jgi:hypothetical protein
MKPATPHRWKVGDRFYLNRWSEAFPTPLIFEITARTDTYMFFWARDWDRRPRSRKMRRPAFYRDVERRVLVRLP